MSVMHILPHQQRLHVDSYQETLRHYYQLPHVLQKVFKMQPLFESMAEKHEVQIVASLEEQ